MEQIACCSGTAVGRNDSKEPQGELISMQLPQMLIVSIQLAMGSVGWFCFLTCLVLAADGILNLEQIVCCSGIVVSLHEDPTLSIYSLDRTGCTGVYFIALTTHQALARLTR